MTTQANYRDAEALADFEQALEAMHTAGRKAKRQAVLVQVQRVDLSAVQFTAELVRETLQRMGMGWVSGSPWYLEQVAREQVQANPYVLLH